MSDRRALGVALVTPYDTFPPRLAKAPKKPLPLAERVARHLVDWRPGQTFTLPEKRSPSASSASFAEAMEWTGGTVELFVRTGKGGFRRDWLGFIDALYLDGEPGVIGVQVTDATSHSARLDKALDHQNLIRFLRAGNRFEVQSWGMRGKAGAKKLWTLRRTRLALSPDGYNVVEKEII